VNEIPDRQDALNAFAHKYLMPKPTPNGNGPQKAASATAYVPTDEDVLQAARKASNAAKFASLYVDGDLSGYDGDDSRADLALASMLAFYTQDPAQIARLIGSSALMRTKWNRRDYQERTIKRALDNVPDTYNWHNIVTVTVTPNGNGNGNDPKPDLPRAVRFAEMGTPEPQRYQVEGLIPEAYPVVLYGDGGVAKSMLALSIGLAVASGASGWLGHAIQSGPVLYADFELDAREQHRRVSRLARAEGLAGPPPDLLYLSALGIPARTAFKGALHECKDNGVRLMVLDSLGPALQGDAEAARDVISFYQQVLEPFRAEGVAVLVIDHQSKLQAGERYQSKRAFGSVFKGNLARSVVQVEATHREDNELTLRLRQVKHNFGPLADPFGVKLGFTEEMVTLSREELDAADKAGEETLNAQARVLYALQNEAAYPDELVEATGLAKGTVKKVLSQLRNAGKAEDTGELGRGGVHQVQTVTVTDDYKGNGNGNDPGEAPGADPEDGFTEEQLRRIRQLVKQGMSEELAREEVLGNGWVEP
jgi:hypothetical protein